MTGESSLTQGISGGVLPLMSITERGMGQTFGGQINQMIGGQVSGMIGDAIGSLISGKSVDAFLCHFPVVAGQCVMPRCIIRPRICWRGGRLFTHTTVMLSVTCWRRYTEQGASSARAISAKA